MRDAMTEPLVEVRNLKKYYLPRKKLLGEKPRPVRAVDGVSFAIPRGTTFGLVGESGCGKTTLGKTIIGLQRTTAGEILFRDREIQACSAREQRELYRRMQMVFQDPYSSLDPRKTVRQIVSEPLRGFREASGAALDARVRAALRDCGLSDDDLNRYPHQVSGGQRQRICIARALILKPDFLLCDEPVSALDVSVQAQVINLLKDMQIQHGIAMLFISHDLSVVEHISDRVAVMYLGRIVEMGDKRAIFDAPAHPYTRALLYAVPIPDIHHRRAGGILTGDVPSPDAPPPGCAFHPRCPQCVERCRAMTPELTKIGEDHYVACCAR